MVESDDNSTPGPALFLVGVCISVGLAIFYGEPWWEGVGLWWVAFELTWRD